ncbi:MAG: tetratricopeptide repeat protein, partial [Chloroflexia bacterium]|nr:tetratricopeptide repeat protein [Chloroflexia bacterium]
RLLPLLVGGSRDLPQRQQTMRGAITWSYELLNPAEQAIFRRLAAFAGGWTLEAAEVVAAWEEITVEQVIDLLSSLVEQSLVMVTREGHETRYGMLEPIRQYALERLEETGEAGETWRRHATYYLALGEQSALALEGRPGQVTWLDRLEREHDNLRAVLTWSERTQDGIETGLRLASALWRFWEVRGHVGEGSTWLAGALARSDALAPAMRARALTAAGNLARDRADYEQATGYHERSLEISRHLGDKRGIAKSLNNLGVIARDRGDAEQTMRLGRESLALFREVGDQHRAAIVLISLGMAAGQQGEFDQGRSYYEESLALFRASGDSWHSAWVQNYLAHLLVGHGDFDTARGHANESLAAHRASGDAWGIAMAFGILGKIAQADDDLDTAAARFAGGLRLLVEAGVERAIPDCLEDLAGVALAWEQPHRAARLLGAGEALRAIIGATQSASLGAAGAVDLTGLRTGSHAAAWAEGRALTREQVITESMKLVEEIEHRTAAQPSGPPGG